MLKTETEWKITVRQYRVPRNVLVTYDISIKSDFIMTSLMFEMVKSSLATLMKSIQRKHVWEKTSRRNVNQNTTDNSHRNVLYIFLIFKVIVKKVIDPDDKF